jgi:nucleoside 2-deoxyribosyltransferase
MIDRKTTRIYLAGPLFTQPEWLWNEGLAQALHTQMLEVILPQRAAMPMLSGERPFDAQFLFKLNIESIQSADVIVAILDGPDIDSGTAWECGYAFKAGKPVIGVRTDIRAGGDDPENGINLMLSISCRTVIAVPLANRTDLASVAALIGDAVRQVAS